jgi:hypothetical protein
MAGAFLLRPLLCTLGDIYGITVKDITSDDHRLGPFMPLARTRQYSVPMGRSTVGTYVEVTTVLFTTMDVNVLFFDTWMV